MLDKLNEIKDFIHRGKYSLALSKLTPFSKSLKSDTLDYAHMLNLFGMLYYHFGEFSISIDFYLSAKKAFKQKKNIAGLIHINYNLSLNFASLKDYRKSLDCLQYLLDNFEGKIDSNTKKHIFLRQADLHSNLQVHDKAKELYDDLLGKIPKTDPFIIKVIINAAINHVVMKENSTAQALFEEALALAKTSKNNRLVLFANMNYGAYLNDIGQKEQALSIFLKNLDFLLENNMRIQTRNTYQNIADVYLFQNKASKAQKYLDMAKVIEEAVERQMILIIKKTDQISCEIAYN